MNPSVTITPVAGLGSLTVLLGPTPATTSADGGWAIVNRPKNVGFTAWEGYSPHTMSLSLMFDGFINNVPQDFAYDSLRRMMRTPVGLARQPSPVQISGPVPMTNLLWVIQGLEVDSTTVIRNEKGELLRQAVTVSLLEYVEADVLVPASAMSPAARLNSSVISTAPVGSGRTYTVKDGDTLWIIAQRELGAGKRYPEIATLNGVRDPNSVPVGTVLKLP